MICLTNLLRNYADVSGIDCLPSAPLYELWNEDNQHREQTDCNALMHLFIYEAASFIIHRMLSHMVS